MADDLPVMKNRPTLAELQMQFRSGMPHDQDKLRLPDFMNKTIRKPRAEGQKNRHPEEDLQIAICQYLDMHPRILYWATPNSTWVGKMTPQKMGYLAKQKRIGVKRGIPDLTLIFKNTQSELIFCWAELKAGSGVTDEQKMYMEKCREMGGFSAVIKSLDDMKNLLNQAGYF